MKKIISIIMPVYNAEFFLEECIQSVLKQSYKNFEFIIINDGSTDKTLSIIENFMNTDDRIICVSREKKGLIFSLNQGLNLSTGTYIARMDGDDICYPERLEMQYNFMIKNQLDICGGDYNTICENGLFKKKYIVPKEHSEILISMASNVPFAHPSVMIKKAFLVNNKLTYGMYGHNYGEDIDLWMNMYSAGAKFGNLAAPVLKYRQVHNSCSRINHLPRKWEVAKKYKLFVYKNHKKIKEALEEFCIQETKTNTRQRDATRALLRYQTLEFDLVLLLKFIRKVSFVNFIFGFLSYINSKLIICWIK